MTREDKIKEQIDHNAIEKFVADTRSLLVELDELFTSVPMDEEGVVPFADIMVKYGLFDESDFAV